ncbi:mitochondrial carrier [Fragilariopsis cylindrus CCMP1102]|uniref:Mitochondrial carrier n=1 Tax=Fragilariopsis cylindrus CCMP1102 TaxID=635003 RepID=A0A1E7FPH6_9STRA|nr:mitochondrial carrier [Fragilariopsis cylindrus CCMP1102]|eukprot:OEU20046.1 mitochondrial carrier [Fragilariopsis cylindrus CCMP1102]
MAEYLVTFAAGASYGLTTVIVGQPLDTIKVRMQGLPSASKLPSYKVAGDLFAKEGIAGLYRGGVPLFFGGSLMRSAQFGVSGATNAWLVEKYGPAEHTFGIFDWQVIVAGAAGGMSRGLIEIPTDYFKTRRQVEQKWNIKQVFDGTGVTLARNTVLYAGFMVYIDLAKQLCRSGHVPAILMTDDKQNLSPFPKGAICANMAWLTVWPADVIKTQRQSGNYATKSTFQLLKDNIKTGRLYRGVLPGLVRSTIANGSSMVVYEYVATTLTKKFDLERTDLA